MHPNPIVLMTAVELSQAIRDRKVSCREVMNAYLDHIEALNPTVNAIVSLRDRAELLAEADAADARLERGEYAGWMHGFPHAVKDLAATQGLRTTFGSPILQDFIPPEDAILVDRLRRSGAIIIGKTNTSEFGLGSQTYNNVFGTTLNAYDATKTAGGSSGGAAAALAMRLVPVADGSDMSGSLRNPAAFNNVFGMRPSQGRVPFGPANEVFVQQLGYEGPMARTVTDLSMLLAVMAGYDDRAPLSIEQDPNRFRESLKGDVLGIRIGWLGDLGGYLAMEPGILELCRAALATMQSHGCVVEEASLGFDPARLWECWRVHRHWLAGGRLLAYYRNPATRDLLKPEAQWEVEQGLRLSAYDVYDASIVRTEWYLALRKLLAAFDCVVMLSAQVFPFNANIHWPKAIANRPMDCYLRWMEVVTPVTLSGCPAISVPVGFSPEGLPIGMQIIGRAHADFDILRIAYAYEQMTGWVTKRLPPKLTA